MLKVEQELIAEESYSLYGKAMTLIRILWSGQVRARDLQVALVSDRWVQIKAAYAGSLTDAVGLCERIDAYNDHHAVDGAECDPESRTLR